MQCISFCHASSLLGMAFMQGSSLTQNVNGNFVKSFTCRERPHNLELHILRLTLTLGNFVEWIVYLSFFLGFCFDGVSVCWGREICESILFLKLVSVFFLGGASSLQLQMLVLHSTNIFFVKLPIFYNSWCKFETGVLLCRGFSMEGGESCLKYWVFIECKPQQDQPLGIRFMNIMY